MFVAGFGSSSLPIGIPPCTIPRGSVGSLSQSPPSPYGSYPHSILSMHSQKDTHIDVSDQGPNPLSAKQKMHLKMSSAVNNCLTLLTN